MIYANEAKKLTKENNARETALKGAIEKILEKVEPSIIEIAKRGYNSLTIPKRQIINAIEYDGYFFAIKEIMNALTNELKEYGYTVEVIPSYLSIHVKW